MTEPLGPTLTVLLADATSEAKRRGNAVVTPLHLIEVLRRTNAAAVANHIPAALLAAVDGRLAGVPRSFETPEPDGDVRRVLSAAAGRPDVIAALCAELGSWLAAGATGGPSGPPADSPTTGTPAEGPSTATSPAGPAIGPPAAGAAEPASGSATAGAQPAEQAAFSLPERFHGIAEIISARSDLVPRDGVVDEVLASVGARQPALAVVVGAEGAGRTTVAECLARRLSDPGYAGPLAGRPVVLVRAEGVIAGGRGSSLLDLARVCSGSALLVLDDLEVLLGLGSGGTDYGMLTAIRSLHGQPDRQVVATLASAFQDRFRAVDRELSAEVATVDLPPLEPAQVAAIAAQAAVTLGGYHRVSVPPEVVTAACAPPGGPEAAAHPGLAVARLDRACAAAATRPDRAVTVADIPHPATPAAVAVFDAAQALSRLTAEVVGQEQALDRVVRRLRVTRTGLDLRPERPDGVFLFAGPTGTGKTATALALARAVYGDPAALVRLDMSEYVEEHTVSNLVGSPPGYVGSTDPAGWLTTRIRERPDVVLLLDEIEKAHPLVWNTFLQVFDAGRLTDRQGQTAQFAGTVVVMTTNIGAGAFSREGSAGFVAQDASAQQDERDVLRAVRQRMAPELINRIDDILVFRPLSPTAVRTIAERQLAAVVARLQPRGWQVDIDPSAVDLLARLGFNREFGARPLTRVIESRFLEPLVACGPGRYRVRAGDDDHLAFDALPTP